VGEKRHRNHPNTLTRCALRSADPSRDWNVFTQIFAEHWAGVKRLSPRYDPRYDDGLVEQLLGCGNPEKRGDIEYRCLHGGAGKPFAAMRGKSSLCLRCATVYVDNWVSPVSKMLHEGLIYRPIVVTMPEIRRPTFSQHAKAVLSPFRRWGVRCLDDVWSRIRGKPLTGGDIVVMQTHGRNGQSTPHRHSIAPRGGGEPHAKPWVHRDYVPYAMLRKQWQGHLLRRLRQPVKTRAIHRLVDTCSTRYRNGCVTNVQQGEVPARYQSLARYLATYVVRPPISLRRIDGDEGQRVTSHYRSQKTDRVERARGDVWTFIGRRIQHVLPKGFQRMRYYGVQATKPCAKIKAMIQDA